MGEGEGERGEGKFLHVNLSNTVYLSASDTHM